MISIVIPAHNEKKNLERLLKCLYTESMASPHIAFEILIILSAANIDGSEDLKCFHGAQIIRCEGKGRAVQMNTGASMAKGNILTFLHADIIPPKGFLKGIESAQGQGYDAGFFSYQFDKDSFLLRINAYFTANDGLFTGAGDQCLFIKKSIFNALDGFDEKQMIMEDFEFFGRMKENKVSYTIIKNDLIVSARKYDYNSYLRVNFANLLLFTLFKLGCPSQKLKLLHNSLLRLPNDNYC